jgi:hypothetical protein
MVTKASSIVVLIIEKWHVPWDLMCSTLPALELRFCCQLQIASARPLVASLVPIHQSGISCACRAGQCLEIGMYTVCGLIRLAWQQIDTHLMVLGAGWAHTVPPRCSGCASSTVTGAHPVVSDVK